MALKEDLDEMICLFLDMRHCCPIIEGSLDEAQRRKRHSQQCTYLFSIPSFLATVIALAGLLKKSCRSLTFSVRFVLEPLCTRIAETLQALTSYKSARQPRNIGRISSLLISSTTLHIDILPYFKPLCRLLLRLVACAHRHHVRADSLFASPSYTLVSHNQRTRDSAPAFL